MITLWTGAPGAGKTADMVATLQKLCGDGSRPLYVQGLDGLKIPHEPLDITKWHDEVPDGAIVVCDEVQQAWRPRGPGHAPSESIKALETHRHRGIDFFLTTQKPNLVDANVRSLVGRHIHIRDTGWFGRWKYEWPECSENIAWKTCALKKRFTLPKKVFSLYKSASMHMVVPKGKSLMVWITLGLVVAALVLVGLVIRTLSKKGEPEPAAVSASAPMRQASGPGWVKGGEITGQSIAASFTPRIRGREETAPAYDELRKVVNMPRVVGGYCQGVRCVCYDSQNRRSVITSDECRQWIASPPFEPYYSPPLAQSRIGEGPAMREGRSPSGAGVQPQ